MIVAHAYNNDVSLRTRGAMTGLIPAVILCHCRNIRRLQHLSIGGPRAGIHWRFLWRDVIVKSVKFPKLETASLEGYPFAEAPWGHGIATFRPRLTLVEEAASFVNRAPNLRHLTLRSFASSPVSKTVSMRSLEHLTSLDLFYCAFLDQWDLRRIIKACPKLERFAFASEASPALRKVTVVSYPFIGPMHVVEALEPVSERLRALSIKYAPLVDWMILGRDDDDEGGDDEGDDDDVDIAAVLADTGGNDPITAAMVSTEDIDDLHLIKSFGFFPNLQLLQISHMALHRWTKHDGPENGQLVELVKGCPKLESLDILMIPLRWYQIRPQLETLTAYKAMGIVTPLLKGIRITIAANEGHDVFDWIDRMKLASAPRNFRDLWAKEHLPTYRRTGVKLRIDLEVYREATFFDPMSPVEKWNRTWGLSYEGFVTVHPYLRDFLLGAIAEIERGVDEDKREDTRRST